MDDHVPPSPARPCPALAMRSSRHGRPLTAQPCPADSVAGIALRCYPAWMSTPPEGAVLAVIVLPFRALCGLEQAICLKCNPSPRVYGSQIINPLPQISCPCP